MESPFERMYPQYAPHKEKIAACTCGWQGTVEETQRKPVPEGGLVWQNNPRVYRLCPKCSCVVRLHDAEDLQSIAKTA